MLRLKECVDEAVAQGLQVTARELQGWFGGDLERIEDHLASLAKLGTVKKIHIASKEGPGPFTAYILIKKPRGKSGKKNPKGSRNS